MYKTICVISDLDCATAIINSGIKPNNIGSYQGNLRDSSASGELIAVTFTKTPELDNFISDYNKGDPVGCISMDPHHNVYL